jgi:RNA polymerase sigma factor for flagellar operon FliA
VGVNSPSEADRNATLLQIWSAYTTNRELIHRNELIVAYQPLVTSTVQRLPAYILSYWEPDELRSFGQDGLMRAITRWSGPDLTKFEPYAQRCIRGAVFDELRRLDWMPRSMRRRIVSYKATHEQLIDELGRTPFPAEVCRAMGLNERQASEVLSALNASQVLHLEGRAAHAVGPISFIDMLADSTAGPEARLLADADLDALRKAVASLGERELKVLSLAFFNGLTQDQIGKIIGVGGPQVCKIQSAALRKLRSILDADRSRQTGATRTRVAAVTRTPPSAESAEREARGPVIVEAVIVEPLGLEALAAEPLVALETLELEPLALENLAMGSLAEAAS